MADFTNTTPPTITGNRVVGGTVTAAPGVWAPVPTDFSYQWQRADDITGTNLADITGATGATYTIDPLDTSKVLRVGVYPNQVLPSTPPRNVGVLRFTGTGNDGPLADVSNFAIVYLASTRTSDLTTIKAATTLTKCMCYKDPTVATDGGANPTVAGWNSPVSKEEALAHDLANPSDQWLIRNSGGTPLFDKVNTHDWLVNMGAASYQSTAGTRFRTALTQVSGTAFDGPFYDNMQPTYAFRAADAAHPTGNAPGFINGVSFADAQWKAAAVSFLSTVSVSLKASGYYTIGNSAIAGDNDGSLTQSWFGTIAPYLNGANVEFYEQGPDQVLYYNPPGGDWHAHYNDWINLTSPHTKANAVGLHFYASGYTGAVDTSKGVYLKAGFLLNWNGTNGAWNARTTNGNPYQAAWFQDIGIPQGAKFTVGNGWRRNYDRGTVILNPNRPGNGSITFNVGTSPTYKRLDGTLVTSGTVTLAETTAMILGI